MSGGFLGQAIDSEWYAIEPLVPNTPRGVPFVDGRNALYGICRQHCIESRYADIPDRYGFTQASAIVSRTASLISALCL